MENKSKNIQVKPNIKKLRNITFSLILITYSIYIIYVTLYESPEITSSYDLISILMFYTGTLLFLIYIFISNLIPKYYKEMKFIKRYLSVKEVNELIKDEIFINVKLSDKIKNNLSKSDCKSFEKTLLISNNWISVNKILIPKKMLVKATSRIFIHSYSKPRLEIVKFITVDNKDYEFANSTYESTKIKCHLNKILKLNNNTNKEKYQNLYKNNNISKEDFIYFIRKEKNENIK